MNLNRFLRGKRPTWVEIDLNRLESNFCALREFLPRHVKIMAVIKADAYGHGALAVATQLERLGVDALAVAIVEEALALRNAGIKSPLILLDGFWAGQEDMIVENELVTAVYGPDMLASLEKAACQARRQTLYHLKVNTGMSRLGVEPAEVAAFFRAQSKYSWTRCDGIYTHLSSADDGESHSTGEQLGRFGEVLAEAQASGVQLRWRHAANSAGILNFKESWFDGVRPGLVLYGVNPLSKPLAHLKLEPVLSFKTRVMQIRQVKRGGSVGYGDTYSAPRDSLIATLPIGYADGLARSLSNRGVVLVRGNKAPIAGRISMDLTTVDVTSVPGVAVNDEVVLIGEQGENSIRVEEVARLAGTIPYELLCCIGRRVPPVYV